MKNKMFKDAIKQLPWETKEDLETLFQLGAELDADSAVAAMRHAICTDDGPFLDYLLKLTNGPKLLRQADDVAYPHRKELSVLKSALGHFPMLKNLVNAGFDINAGTHSGHYYIGEEIPGQYRNITSLLQVAVAGFQDRRKLSSLFNYPVPENKTTIEEVAYLLEQGAKPLTVKENNNPEVQKLLDKAGYVKDSDKILIQAIKDGDIKTVKKMLDLGINPDISARMYDNLLPYALNWAIEYHNPQIARLLRFHGAHTGGIRDGRKHGPYQESIEEFIERKFSYEREKWAELIQQDRMLSRKFPDNSYGGEVAEMRKTSAQELAAVRSTGNVQKARETRQAIKMKLAKLSATEK